MTLGKKNASNLILNLLYLRDYTNFDTSEFGIRLNLNQEQVDTLLIQHKDDSILV